MDQSNLTKIWTLVALAATYFCINIFVVTQGGDFLLPGLKLNDGVNPYPAAVHGIWFALPLVLVSYLLMLAYSRRSAGLTWYDRFPCAFNLNLNYSDSLARKYQAFFIVVTLLLPAYSAGHFVLKSLDGTVMIRDKCISDLCPHILHARHHNNSIAQACARLDQIPRPADGYTVTDRIVLSGPAGNLQNYSDFTTIFTHGNCYRYEDVMTFFPFWEPWLGVIFSITLLILMTQILFRLFWGWQSTPAPIPAPVPVPSPTPTPTPPSSQPASPSPTGPSS